MSAKLRTYSPTLRQITKVREKTGESRPVIKRRLTLENIEKEIRDPFIETDVESILLQLVRLMR